jgi:four helix bundle protein
MSNAKVKSYRDLVVWQRSKAFAVEMYRVTEAFPRGERYGSIGQIRRAAVSIPSNIAEGHIRGSDKAFANHLDIALGSAAELDTQLDIALAINYLKQETYRALATELQEIMKMLRGLSRTVRNTPPSTGYRLTAQEDLCQSSPI